MCFKPSYFAIIDGVDELQGWYCLLAEDHQLIYIL